MAGDDAHILGLLAQELGGALAHIAMAGAMEAVAADVQIFIILVGNAVQIGLGRHGLMEGGVEHGHHGGAGHDLLAGLDAHQVGGVVQGAQGDVFADGVHNGVVNNHGLGELFAAMQHAMAHGADLGHVGHHAMILVGQGPQHVAAGLHMGGHILVDDVFVLAAGILLGQLAALDADALHQALGQDGFILHIHQLIFERRRTGVDDQDFHKCVSSHDFVLCDCSEPLYSIFCVLKRGFCAFRRKKCKKAVHFVALLAFIW